MSSLLPIGLPAANPTLPSVTQKTSTGFFPAAADGSATPANSFHSLLKQSSDALRNDPETEASPSDRSLKAGQDANALLAGTAPVPVSPVDNQPLPFKWSLNIFKNVPEPQSSASDQASEQPVNADSRSLKQDIPATALLTPAAVPAATQKPHTLSPLSAPVSKQSNQPPAAPGTQSPASTSVTASNQQNLAPASNDSAKAALDEQQTSAADDLDAAEQTQTLAALPLPVSTITTTSGSAAALVPAGVTTKGPNTAAAPLASKNDRSGALKPAAGRTDNSSAATTTPALATPPILTALAPSPAPANEPLTHTVKSESTPTPPVQPRAEQSHAGAVLQGAPKTVAPELAFALRVQPNSTPVASVPANATQAPQFPTPDNMAQSAAPGMSEPRQNAVQEPASATPVKPADPTPVATPAQSAQSSAGQSGGANTGSDQKNDDPRQGVASAGAEAAGSTTAGQVSQAIYAHPTVSNAAPPASPATPERTPQSVATTAAAATPAATAPKTGSASQISISVPAGDQQNVQVRLMDRAGEVHVTVRAPNEELAGNLRSDLTSLTGKLNQGGFSTEAFTPSSGGQLSRDQRSPDPQQQNGADRQTPGRNQQQQSSQQNPRGNRPAWLDEFENSMVN